MKPLLQWPPPPPIAKPVQHGVYRTRPGNGTAMNLREKLAEELGRGVIADRVLKVLDECTCGTCADWAPDHPQDQWSTKRWGRCNGKFDEDSEKPEDHGCYAWRSK